MINVGHPTESSHNINMQENLKFNPFGFKKNDTAHWQIIQFPSNKGGTDSNTHAPMYDNAYV